MAARLYESEARGWDRSWTLLRSLKQATEAHLEAQRLSGTRRTRAIASEGDPVTRHEYQKSGRAWLVEVDD